MGALYSHTTRSDGLTLTASIYNTDHQNHIDNGIPAQLDDYSTNATIMGTTTDPGESGAESLATSLAGELERIRFAILETKQQIAGTAVITQWYSSPLLQHFINETSNLNQSVGLTIHMGANNDEILSFKATDVAHGVTDIAETDTFGLFTKQISTTGGLRIEGLSEVTAGIVLRGTHTTANTTKSTAALAGITLNARLKSGTGVTAVSANGNLASIENNGTARFIFDAEGDSHQDVGTAWTNFDSHDDVALLHGLSAGVSRPGDPVREQFQDFLEDNRDKLTDLKLVTFNDDGHHFVNMSKLAMLNTGAIRQLSARLEQVERLLLPSR